MLVFVSSRRQTRLTALDLIGYAAGDERPRQFVRCPEDELDQAVATIKVSNLPVFTCRTQGSSHTAWLTCKPSQSPLIMNKSQHHDMARDLMGWAKRIYCAGCRTQACSTACSLALAYIMRALMTATAPQWSTCLLQGRSRWAFSQLQSHSACQLTLGAHEFPNTSESAAVCLLTVCGQVQLRCVLLSLPALKDRSQSLGDGGG